MIVGDEWERGGVAWVGMVRGEMREASTQERNLIQMREECLEGWIDLPGLQD